LQSVAVGIYLLSDFAAKNQLVLPWQLMLSSETPVGRLQHTWFVLKFLFLRWLWTSFCSISRTR